MTSNERQTPFDGVLWRLLALLGPLGHTSLIMVLFLLRSLRNPRAFRTRHGANLAGPPALRWLLISLGLLVTGTLISAAAASPHRWVNWTTVAGFALVNFLMIKEGAAFAYSLHRKTLPERPGETADTDGPSPLDSLLAWVTLGGLLSVAWGIGLMLVRHPQRAFSPFLGENGYGTLLILSGGLGFGYLTRWVQVELSRTGGPQAGPGVRTTRARLGLSLIPWLYLTLTMVVLAATRSRGAWLGFTLFLLVFAAGQPHKQRLATSLALLGFLLLLNVPPLQARFDSILSLEANDDRVQIWQAAVDMIRAHPWLGVGPGNFGIALSHYGGPGLAAATAHNLLLNTWAEYGIFVLILLIVYLGSIVWFSARLVRHDPPNPLPRALLGVNLGVLLHQMVDHTLFSLEILGFFMAVNAVAIAGLTPPHPPAGSAVRSAGES